MTYIFDTQRLKDTFKMMNKLNVVNLVWKGDKTINGLCCASMTGNGSLLFDVLKPISYEDFYEKLCEYSKLNKNKLNIYERGLTFEELTKLAKCFKNKVEKHDNKIVFTIENYIDYILYVNVIQTFDGHVKEIILINYIKKYWYSDAHRSTGKLDSKYGIDILYRNNSRGIQLKSIKFFLGKKSSVISDRKNILPLKNEVLEKFNIDMKYAIYDSSCNSYLISSNGTPIFSFEEFYYLLESNEVPHPILKYTKTEL
jgi:hypothetical protein